VVELVFAGSWNRVTAMWEKKKKILRPAGLCVDNPKRRASPDEKTGPTAGDDFEEAVPMNVGTQQSPSRVRPDSMQRRPLAGNDDGLRMEHSGFRVGGMTEDFWDSVQKMPRADQMNLAALAVISQSSSDGVNPDSRHFVQNLKNRFSNQELQSVRDTIRSHPLVKNRTSGEIDKLMEQLQGLWSPTSGKEAQDIAPVKPETVPLRSPDQIFFQTTMLQPSRSGVRSGSMNSGAVNMKSAQVLQ